MLSIFYNFIWDIIIILLLVNLLFFSVYHEKLGFYLNVFYMPLLIKWNTIFWINNFSTCLELCEFWVVCKRFWLHCVCSLNGVSEQFKIHRWMWQHKSVVAVRLQLRLVTLSRPLIRLLLPFSLGIWLHGIAVLFVEPCRSDRATSWCQWILWKW